MGIFCCVAASSNNRMDSDAVNRARHARRKIAMYIKTLTLYAFLGVSLLFGHFAKADVIDTPTEKTLSTRSGSPTLVLPKQDWKATQERNRPDGTAAYYHMVTDRNQLSFSVYIDRTTVCQSAESCLQAALKNQSYKEAKEMQQSTAGPFKFAQFFLDQPQRFPVKRAHG